MYQQHLPVFQQSSERLQHISELTSQVPTCKALNRDQSLFEAPLRLVDGRVTNLRISLPPNFPQGRPILSVTHPIKHAWVDGAGRLTFPALDNWSHPHSRLASIVHEAYSGLSGQPPRSPTTSPTRPRISDSPLPSPRASGRVSGEVASVPRSFPELDALSAEQLSLALTDEATYARLVTEIAAKSNATQVIAQMKKGIKDQAEANLAKEGVIGELKNQVAIIRSSEFAAAKEAFDEKAGRQLAVLAKLQPKALIQSLKRAAAEVDAASEKVYDRFLAGELAADAFVEQYVKLRTVTHQRELKAQAAEATLQNY